MPTSLGEAVTQLSFLEFLQRCNLFVAPPQPPQLPVTISCLDAAVQTTPPSAASQDVSTQTSDRPVTRYLLTQLCRHLYAVLCHTILTHNYRSRSSSLVVSSLTILLTVRARHRQNAILVVPHRLNLLTLLRHAVSAVPVLTETVTCAPRPHVSCCSHHRVSNSMPRLQVLRSMPTYAPHMVYLLKQPPCDLVSVHPSPFLLCTIHVGTHPVRSSATYKRSASTALAGTHNAFDADPRAGTGPFPKPRALVLPLVHVGQSKPAGHGYIDTAESDLMHHQYRLSFLQWNPGPARRNPTNIIAAACVRFHAVIIQEASDHVHHISDQFIAHTGNTDLTILLNKDTFEPPTVLTFREDSTSKGTWSMVLLIVRGLLRRPSLTGTPTVTFCSVHIHNVVAKKRDASTDLLRRLHGYMKQHNVDFIGGDFNMSAFSTVGDVFSDPEFSALGNSFLWGLGALEEQNRERTGFLIMPKRPYEWRVHSHGCYKFDNATLGLGPRDQTAHLLVFLHLRTTNLPEQHHA